MDTTEIVVVVGAAALIAVVLWYFFGEGVGTKGKGSHSPQQGRKS
jgi:hypothetical protein